MISNVLVTGGSRGIGRAVCVRLASEGRHIIINYVSNEAAARETLSLVEAAGGTGELLKFDVGDIAETSAALKSWQEAHPDEYIDVLVNNAGIRRDNLLLWMEPEDWFGVMKTNLDSFYNVTRPVFRQCQREQCLEAFSCIDQHRFCICRDLFYQFCLKQRFGRIHPIQAAKVLHPAFRPWITLRQMIYF